MPVPIIFDTDAGSDVDDLWALALIVSHPELNLAGVTTVSGDTQARARLVAKTLRLAGREDVPVRAGLRVPVASRDDVSAEPHGGPLTHTDLVRADDPEAGAGYGDAVDFILETLDAAVEPVTIVGTGPWTNIAEVLSRADDRQRSRIGCVALMGGEVHLMMAESNVKHDPEAAAAVFKAAVPVFDATWSVSRRLTFSMDEVRELCAGSSRPLVEGLCEATRMWWGDGMKFKPGPVCYDVIPVFWAAGERESISCIRLDEIPVELTGAHTRGMTVSHPWRVMYAEHTEVTSSEFIAVTEEMDADALKRRYVELVFG